MGSAAGRVQRLCYLQGGEADGARVAVRQMVDIVAGASGGSDDEEAELQLLAAAHRRRPLNFVDSEEQEGAAAEQPPSSMGQPSRTPNASPPVVHKLDETPEGRLRRPGSCRQSSGASLTSTRPPRAPPSPLCLRKLIGANIVAKAMLRWTIIPARCGC